MSKLSLFIILDYFLNQLVRFFASPTLCFISHLLKKTRTLNHTINTLGKNWHCSKWEEYRIARCSHKTVEKHLILKPLKTWILKSEKINLLLIQIRIWDPHWFVHDVTASTDPIKKTYKLLSISKYTDENNKAKFQIFSYTGEETISQYKGGSRISAISRGSGLWKVIIYVIVVLGWNQYVHGSTVALISVHLNWQSAQASLITQKLLRIFFHRKITSITLTKSESLR